MSALAGLFLILATSTAPAQVPELGLGTADETETPLEGNARCFKCHADPRISALSAETLAGIVRIPPGTRPVFRAPESIALLHLTQESYESSAHGKMDCTECHLGIDLLPHEQRLATLDCKDCHQENVTDIEAGPHNPNIVDGKARPTCLQCHGEPHTMSSLRRPRDLKTAKHIVEMCVKCHSEAGEQTFDPGEDYRDSIHGHALYEKGLSLAPVCVDCHGDHAMFPSSNPASPVHPHRAPATCGACHEGVLEIYLASIHGETLRDETKDPATCTRCHGAHGIGPVDQPFLREIVRECSDCHLELGASYLTSYHGKVTQLGSGDPVAVCSSCHGYHDILPKSDPASRVSEENLLQTCRQCHKNAKPHFAQYVTHLDKHNLKDYPQMYYLWIFMEILILGTMGFFLTHAVLWFQRGIWQRLLNPRGFHIAPPTERRIRRFHPIHRVIHFLIIVSFMGLVATGFPLKYSYMEWSHEWSAFLGGTHVMGLAHRAFAIVTFSYAALHLGFLGYLVIKNWPPRLRALTGPNSMIPWWTDLRDFLKMVRWFFYLGPRPQFDRWTYFEKFDYWGAFWGISIIGCSGVILWQPTFFTQWLPGWIINCATIVHSSEALLAAAFIFMIHFFNTHLRPEKFPIDLVMLTGQMTETEMKEERALEYERLVETGQLQERLVKPLPLVVRALGTIAGMAAFLFGITLIIMAIRTEIHHLLD